MLFPVIILLDNDKKTQGVIKKGRKNNNYKQVGENVFSLEDNIYLLTIPNLGGSNETVIEDYFPIEIRDIKYNHLGFDFRNTKQSNHENPKHSKSVFAQKIIIPQAKKEKIDFTEFRKIFQAIESAQKHYIEHRNEVLSKYFPVLFRN